MIPTQRKLSIIMAAVAVAGMVAIGLLWRDTTEHYSQWMTKSFKFDAMNSTVSLRFGDYTGYPHARTGFSREGWHSALPEETTLFPRPAIDRRGVEVPLWFLLCAFPALVGLLWMGGVKACADRQRFSDGKLP